jgi:hypothetical protein
MGKPMGGKDIQSLAVKKSEETCLTIDLLTLLLFVKISKVKKQTSVMMDMMQAF